MRYRLFGATGLRVSELFLGAMTFGEQGGVGAAPEECRRIVDAYAYAGGTAIHPIIGARRLDQLVDNLGAAELELPGEALSRLGAATEIDLGFPATFIRETSPWVFGAAALPDA